MTNRFRLIGLAAAMAVVAGCSRDQRASIDSAAGSAEDYARATLSVINIDMGRRAGTDKKITDETETFASTDTIYASVNTSGTVRDGQIKSQWVFPDGSIVDQNAEPVAGDGDANLLFFITKPEGLAKGKYVFRVLVDGREVRSEEVTVQ